MVYIIDKKTSKKALDKLFSGIKKNKKGFDAFKYCGLIKFKTAPLDIQKKLRDEWG